MESKENGSLKPNRKLYVFSGHDVSLVNIMEAMNISAQTTDKPDFGATLYFELHRSTSSSQLEVKVSCRLKQIKKVTFLIFFRICFLIFVHWCLAHADVL